MDTHPPKKSEAELIIAKLKSGQNFSTLDLSAELRIPHQEAVGACKSLEMNEVIKLEKLEKKLIELTADGKDCLERGSPENQVIIFLSDQPNNTAKKELLSQKLGPIGDRGFSILMKQKLISFDKTSNSVTLKQGTPVPSSDEQQEIMKKFISNNDPSSYDEPLLKNYQKTLKLISVDVIKYFSIQKGPNFENGLQVQETDLTRDLLHEDNYLKSKFKKYNYQAQGKEVSNGALHVLLRVRAQFREILLELGFQEMPTNCFVESSFWNFDSLFQPQQHPARDAHDTFFLPYPKYSKIKQLQPDYFQRVKEVHEIGGYGSIGWQYNYSEEESSKNILRTHTTAISSKMLFQLAEEYKRTGVFTPKKFFSIDRVFRNEALDSTHLAEFHQIEGLVADYDLGLGHLIGTIEDFFHKFGIKKLRFKPAYNPYTEPSMEIFAYSESHKRWLEIGNSGIFRPEMLLPMGLPKNVNVIAWGLSLERPTMIHYKFPDIRALFGHTVNITDTKKASIYCININ
jgi:phenylalanyl-tRNA synthetase alpha chain